MTASDAFLAMVAAALGRTRGREVSPEPSTQLSRAPEDVQRAAHEVRQEAIRRGDELMSKLEESSAQSGWIVRRVASPEDAADAVLDICRATGTKTVLRADMPVFERVPVEAALRNAGIDLRPAARADITDSDQARLRIRQAAFSVDAGITGVEYAIAETGTVVLHPRKGLSRLVSLAPPRHVAIVERGQVLPSLDELFLLERDSFLRGELTASFNLISGPSRTADIAATVVKGVHGPVEVYLVLMSADP